MPPIALLALYAIVSFAASAALTKFVLKKLVERAVLDTPNERSSHETPVPRGGGIAVMAVIIAAMSAALVSGGNFGREWWIVFSALLLAAVSWIDDRKSLSVGVRLFAHLLAAYLGTLSFHPEQTIFGDMFPLWLERTAIVLGWAWFMNLYNFMDGIDGITCAETVFIAMGCLMALIITQNDDYFVSISVSVTAAACAGFALYNWHPAKIFLGDVGSVPLGFITGYGLLFLAMRGYPAAALILPLYYLSDSGITLAKRLFRREKIWQAHRQHFYQTAARKTGRHDLVVIWIILANFALAGAALVSITYPLLGIASAILATALLLEKMNNPVR